MKQELTHDTVERYIGASPEVLYDIVSDVTRTPELSPEVVACEWLDGATGPAVGVRFRATNHAGRGRDWHNTPVITVAERGREFAFSRTEKGAGTIVWRYVFAPDGSGTRVAESYEVTRPVTLFGWFIIGVVYGNKDRRGDLRRGMTETLQRLAALTEKSATPS
ncbi:MAG TPA: SRPBCC family protein [Nocardioidaceae bacterium]|nr:SRPBCC family protein [Nocardioidaceae bacterium]